MIELKARSQKAPSLVVVCRELHVFHQFFGFLSHEILSTDCFSINFITVETRPLLKKTDKFSRKEDKIYENTSVIWSFICKFVLIKQRLIISLDFSIRQRTPSNIKMTSQLRGLSQNNRDVEIPSYLVILARHSHAVSNLAFSNRNKEKYVILL